MCMWRIKKGVIFKNGQNAGAVFPPLAKTWMYPSSKLPQAAQAGFINNISKQRNIQKMLLCKETISVTLRLVGYCINIQMKNYIICTLLQAEQSWGPTANGSLSARFFRLLSQQQQQSQNRWSTWTISTGKWSSKLPACSPKWSGTTPNSWLVHPNFASKPKKKVLG